ncbi:MAG TPA: MBL fold metallo-hydrolase, partial [Candidatus Nanoarchaeia archaeon]|nr:MBL fold metallo-hydrolase [Candidatus Nanoarchaeia archaeon]
MEIVFLGTSSMVPTKERNQSGVFLRYGTHGLLFDCGEGIQRQFKVAGLKITSVTKVIITHWHGDHVLGLPGLVQTLSAVDSQKSLEIYGPKGTKERIEHLFKAFVFDKDIDLKVVEVSEGKFFDSGEFTLEALPMEHGIETLGYSFVEKDRRRMNQKKLDSLGIRGPVVGKLQDGQSITVKGKTIRPEDVSVMEKGKKVTYITDTKLNENCFALAHGADILICE